MPEIFVWNCDQSRVEDVFGPVMFKLENSFLGWNICYGKENGESQCIYITCSNASDEIENEFPKKFVIVCTNISPSQLQSIFDEEDDIEVIEVEEEFLDYFKDWFLDFITKHFDLLRRHLHFAEEEKELDEKQVDMLLTKYRKMLNIDPEEEEDDMSPWITSPKSMISPKSQELLDSVKQTLLVAIHAIETPEAVNALLECTKLLAPFSEE